MSIQSIGAQVSFQPAAHAVQTLAALQQEAQKETLTATNDGDESLGSLGGKINTLA